MSTVAPLAPSRPGIRAGIIGLIVAGVVFVGLQAVPIAGALILPFTEAQYGQPLAAITVILVGVLLAFSYLIVSTSRRRGGIAALIALVGWVGGLVVHEQLTLHGVNFNMPVIGGVFALILALLLSLAWLVAIMPPRRAWLSLVVLVLIPILALPAEALIRAVQGGFAAPTDMAGQYAIVEFVTTLRMVLLVFLPFALVIIGSRLLSRRR